MMCYDAGVGQDSSMPSVSRSARRQFLVRDRQRIARARLAERAELLEAGKRLAHGEDLVTRAAGADLRVDEVEQCADVVVEMDEVTAVTRHRMTAAGMTEV
jgi:hypothetical protein